MDKKNRVNDVKNGPGFCDITVLWLPLVPFTTHWHQATAWRDLLKRITAGGLKNGMFPLPTCPIFTVFGLRVQFRLWCQCLSLQSLKTQSISPRNTRKRQLQCWHFSRPLILEVDKCHVDLPARWFCFVSSVTSSGVVSEILIKQINDRYHVT